MLRVYVDNESFPEMRGIPPRWPRTRTWWRAIGRAARHGDLLGLVLVQFGITASFLVLDSVIMKMASWSGPWVHVTLLVVGGGLIGYLQVSWGGDMMRRHLRGVSDVARFACPRCGHSLYGHWQEQATPVGDGAVRCPECFFEVDRSLFDPPYRIPASCRVFPPWR